MLTNPNHLQHRLADIRDNPHLLQFYAKANCRDCIGRGMRTVSLKGEFGWQDHTILCECVKKAVKKEAKELEQTDG